MLRWLSLIFIPHSALRRLCFEDEPCDLFPVRILRECQPAIHQLQQHVACTRLPLVIIRILSVLRQLIHPIKIPSLLMTDVRYHDSVDCIVG